MRARVAKPTPLREPSSDDLLDKEAFDHAARGVVEQLRRAYAGRPGRQIGQLVREEIQNIAVAAVSYWIVKRCEQVDRVSGSTDDHILRRSGVDLV